MKKLLSVLSALFIFAICGVFTACGDKYSNMEYKILYAYTQDAEDWEVVGDDGITVNYGGEKGGPLIETEDGYYLYIKVEIENVKPKYIDDIIVSKVGTSSGVTFTSQVVREGEVFAVHITGNALSSLKFFETNSGKSMTTSLNVYRNLDSIEVDHSIKPAVVNGGWISLAGLKNVIYNPIGLTNQTGVYYSVKSSGYFDGNIYSSRPTSTLDGITISEKGVLSVDKNKFTVTETNYVIEIGIESVFDETLTSTMYVYVVDSIANDALALNYVVNTEGESLKKLTDEEIALYTNTDPYSTTTIAPTYSLSDIYSNGINTAIGSSKYDVSIYVDGELYDIKSGQDYHGVIIENVTDNTKSYSSYKITATTSSVSDVTITFSLEIADFDFSQSNTSSAQKKSLTITKKKLATDISFNGELAGADGLKYNIYSTNSEEYQGLELTLLAVPTEESIDQAVQVSVGESVSDMINITGDGVEKVDNIYQVPSGTTIYINFTTNITTDINISFSILTIPSYYNGSYVEPTEADYKTINCTLSSKVTADKLELMSSAADDAEPESKMYINSEGSAFVYAKVYYTGAHLDSSSIVLTSDNENIKFKNGSTKIALDNQMTGYVTQMIDGGDVPGSSQKYNLYKIALASVAYGETGRIKIDAAEGLVGVSNYIDVESVKLAKIDTSEEDKEPTFIFSTTSNNASPVSNSTNQYSIAFNELIEFSVKGRTDTSRYSEDIVVDIKIESASLDVLKATNVGELNDKLTNDNYSTVAITKTKLSKHLFNVRGLVGSKTQAFAITVSYYAEDDNGKIIVKDETIYLELAVYNPIANIAVKCDDTDISFINAEFTESASTTIEFSAYAKNSAEPSASVEFVNTSWTNANSVLLNLNGVSDSDRDKIEVTYNNTDITDYILSADGYPVTNFISQLLKVEITGELSVNKFTINFTARRFDVNSSVERSLTINVIKAEMVKGIELNEYNGGNVIQEESNNSRYAYMSFMNVSGDYAEIQFLARAYYESNEDKGNRYSDLTYNIYEVQYNEDNKIIYENGVAKVVKNNSRLEVFMQAIEVGGIEYQLFTVKANRALGGGTFKFEIASKDSYIYDEDLDVGKYTTTNDFYIEISDGSIKNPYTIASVEDFYCINNDLSKNYVLIEDITIEGTGSKMYSPIGLIGEDITAFSGTLRGTMDHLTSSGSVLSGNIRTITFNINNYINSVQGDKVYFGLFASTTSSAVIEDLGLIVNISVDNVDFIKETYFGGLIGYNAGEINNVDMTISGSLVHAKETDIYFGGLVGENVGKINNVNIDNTMGLSIDANSTKAMYIGLVAGYNNGYITGAYTGKDSLTSLNHDIVANISVKNDLPIENSSAGAIYVGAVAGKSVKEIEDLLIGGRIEVTNAVGAFNRTTYLGGVVGAAQGTDTANPTIIANCTAIGLDLIQNTSTDSAVAGIVADAENVNISNVSFMSALIDYYDIGAVKSKISGNGKIAGIAVCSSGVTITYATVENFITGAETFYTLQATNENAIIAGIALGNATIEASLVNANIKGRDNSFETTVSNIHTLGETSATYSYFVGEVAVTKANNDVVDITGTLNNYGTSSYTAVKLGNDIYVNGDKLELNNYLNRTELSSNAIYGTASLGSVFDEVESVLTEETIVNGTYYYLDNIDNVYKRATTYTEGIAYYTLDNEAWTELASDLYIEDTDNKLVKATTYDEYETYYTIKLDATSLYTIDDNGNYIKNTSGEVYTTETYYEVTLNTTAYETMLSDNDKVIVSANADKKLSWTTTPNTNVINIEDILYYFPYLNVNGKPLMIVQPTDIDISVDNYVVKSIGSNVIEEENTNLPITITNNVLVNYHNNSDNPLDNSKYNTHTLLDKYATDSEGNYILDDDGIPGLVNLTVIPEDAQGGVVAEIYSGSRFATIKDKEITFLGVSGSEPIIVKFYSIFNPELVEYVAFYTELGVTDLLLQSNAVEAVDNEPYDYIMYTYTGASKTLISFSAENIYKDNSFDTIFDSQLANLQVVATSSESIVEVESSSANSMGGIAVWCTDFAGEDSYVEDTIEFELRYKVSAIYNNASVEYITLAKTTLNVVVYKSATSLNITSGDIVASTGTNIGMVVDLYTGYVDEDATEASLPMLVTPAENRVNLSYLDNNNQDSISVHLAPSGDDDTARINQLLLNTGNDNIIDLFDINATYSPIKVADKVVGYNYAIHMELIDEHNYRYITENIDLVVTIQARTNASVVDSITITFTPQELNTMRIENYTATDMSYDSTYVDLFGSNRTETSIISPGGLGGIMMIYLEPSYANVNEAVLTSSSLYVPSLGKDVKIVFEQLVRYVDSSGNVAYKTISNEYTEEGDLKLQLNSNVDSNGKFSYDGIIYIHTQLEAFKGYNKNIIVTLNVKTDNGDKTIEKYLLTEYLPGASLSYHGTEFRDGYLVQKDTYLNTMELRLYGYEFNSNPGFKVEWALDEDNTKFIYTDRYGVKSSTNTQYIKDSTTNNVYSIANYVQVVESRDVSLLTKNQDGSYTLPVYFNVYANVPEPFKITASLSLTTEDSTISSTDNRALIFYPTDYVIQDVTVHNLINNTFNIAINSTEALDLVWTTLNDNNDFSSEIFDILMSCLVAEYNNELISNEDALSAEDRLINLFSMNGWPLGVDQDTLHPEFTISVKDNRIALLGLGSKNGKIEFNVHYGYDYDKVTGVTTLKFGTSASNTLSKTMNFSFGLSVRAVSSEDVPVPIYTADDFIAMTDNENYILMNDIELVDFTPITAKIASLDGNNRIIKIRNFAVETNRTNYGLFDSISTYTDLQGNSHETLLKNVIVDYSNFNNLELTNNNISSVVFGGLVANNNGGLIYNCDVVNMGTTSKVVNIIVDNSNSVKVTFGGLVGVNSGIITNSRVGTSTYIEIRANKTGDNVKSARTLGGLEFVIGNMTENTEQGFVAQAGGFVGSNTGTISTSYLANTSLINYSTAPGESMTAGFVANNSGLIYYSYVKAQESSISVSSPRATGNVIEAKTNGNVAGFVYQNSGEINNSYANTVLVSKSAFLAGFVYNNTGAISESYSACTLNSSSVYSSAEQPFVGVDASDNLLSTGTLENCFYYETDSDKFNVKTQDGKAQAVAYNTENFTNSEALTGFVFVLSDSKTEREQGVWSYYNNNGNYTILPELANANNIARSNRYEITDANGDLAYTNAINYTSGSANNPHIIRSVDEYNSILATDNSFVGYVRFINNIDFKSSATAIKTRTKFTLGDTARKSITSIEGNGMTISGIYLDILGAQDVSIGLFSEIYNTYIKNLNLEFAQPANGQFSSVNAIYSGGLAGKMHNTIAINIDLNGSDTTISGNNFVGGLAGLITGESLIYGVDSNLSVMATMTSGQYLYYNNEDFNTQKSYLKNFNGKYDDGSDTSYVRQLSYAGAIAGVIDVTNTKDISNLAYITVDGTTMQYNDHAKASIYAYYAGGVAGYIGADVMASRVKFNVGTDNVIKGEYSVGGLFAVSLGSIETSQVTTIEDTQYEYDTITGQYIIDLSDETVTDATLDKSNIGNTTLLEGYGYAGGLVGLSIDSIIKNSYAKASFTSSADVIGGLVGVSIGDTITYSYAVPYVNLGSDTQYVGGLIGSAYGTDNNNVVSRNTNIAEYISILANLHGKARKNAEIQSTFSTLIVDNTELSTIPSTAVIDFICADYTDVTTGRHYLKSPGNQDVLIHSFAGEVDYATNADSVAIVKNTNSNRASTVPLSSLYDITDPEHYTEYQKVFSGWSTTYWTLDADKYFPLLLKEESQNFIIIDGAEDLYQIESNSDGNFKVTDDINMENWCKNNTTNYIFNVDFTGTLIGEKADGTTPILYNLFINAKDDTGAGFFRSTIEATISNIAFSWSASDTESNVNYNGITINNTVKTVGMVSDTDTASLFTGVTVGIDLYSSTQTHTGVLVKSNGNYTITAFGGIVGNATASTIMDCNVYGGIDVNLATNVEGTYGNYIGGIVGYANGVDNGTEGEDQYKCIILSSTVSAGKKNNISFKVNTKASKSKVYYGGAIGYAEHVAISSTKVGDAGLESCKTVTMSLNISGVEQDTYFAGLIGYSLQSKLSTMSALVNMSICGAEGVSGINHNVAGMIAGFESNSDLPIEDMYAKANITLGQDSTALTIKNLRVAGIVADAEGFISIVRSAVAGEIKSENPQIVNIYAGGLIAYAGAGADINIEQCLSAVDMSIGSSITNQIFAAGFVGKLGNYTNIAQTEKAPVANVTISSAVTTGRITIVGSEMYEADSSKYYFGGMLGDADNVTNQPIIRDSYSTTSIIISSMTPDTVQTWNKNALFGSIKDSAIVDNVYYSSDVALAPEDSGLGTNLPAYSLFFGTQWTDFIDKNSNYSTAYSSDSTIGLPMLVSLTESMTTLEIVKNTGKFIYSEGTAFNPILINTTAYDFSKDKGFVYYLISSSITPSFVSADSFNGIIIGGETEYTYDNFSGLLSNVSMNSAVSNLHIKVTNEISNGIVLENKGTVFNCSVQGTGLTVSGSLGLIVNENYGLVSHSYSSAEIISCTADIISGIVGANEAGGIINTCYFTGYISNTSTAAGIIGAMNSGYVYNSYMAGVIEQLSSNGNSFVASGTLNGSNNYIDMLANVETAPSGSDNIVIKFVSTAEIMSHAKLAGVWYDAVYATSEAGRDTGIKLDINNKDNTDADGNTVLQSSYGYNYAYPVYNFHKEFTSGNEIIAYQLYTGTGCNVDGNKSIYDNPTSKNILDDFKIPHLGVLDAIRSIASVGLKYQLIYDIDKATQWHAIGDINDATDNKINGFNIKTADTIEDVFNGQFISNRYYDNMAFDAIAPYDAQCNVAGLSIQGLFANINNATIAYLNLGAFSGLTNSGPLGTTVVSNKDSEDRPISAIIHDIAFVKVDRSKSNIEIAGTTNVGGLLGIIDGNVKIYNINTEDIAPTIIGVGTSDNIGFIAGKVTSGTITIGQNLEVYQSITSDGEYAEEWSVKLGNSNYAGGLVGQMTGGTIAGDGEGLGLTISASDRASMPSSLGGIIGLTGYKVGETPITETLVTISNVTLLLNGTLNAESFGGLVAHSNMTAKFDSCSIDAGFSDVTIQNATGSFGLIVAELTKEDKILIVDNFMISEEAKFFFSVTESGDTTGVGALVGYQSGGNLAVSFASAFEPTISTNGGNLGGVTGNYNGGLFYLTKSDTYMVTIQGATNVGGAFGKVTKNVYQSITEGKGVLISNANANGMKTEDGKFYSVLNDCTGFAGTVFNFLASKEKFANVQLCDASQQDEPNTYTTYSNFGGLFGLYIGSDLGIKPVEEDVEETDTEIDTNNILVNNNKLTFETNRLYETVVQNVGGIVGMFNSEGTDEMGTSTIYNIYGIENKGSIKVIEDDEVSSTKAVTYVQIEPSGRNAKDGKYTPLTLNVGGIVGYAHDTTIQDCINSAEITGYQNVGGIVGYADGIDIISTKTYSTNAVNGNTILATDDKFYFERVVDEKDNTTTYNYANRIDTNKTYYTLTTTATNTGEITGVMNVGGIVGVATAETIITNIWNNSAVTGNTSVGGLVGYSNESTITSSCVVGDNKSSKNEINALYYIINSGEDNKVKQQVEFYIPTSIGGLLGSAVSTSLLSNTVYGAEITSVGEGQPLDNIKNYTQLNSSVISTVSNGMVPLAFGTSTNNEAFISSTEAYVFDYEKGTSTIFNDQTSGFGGFIGSTDKVTIEGLSKSLNSNDNNTNSLNANINAKLGVNVGTVYGYAVSPTVTMEDGAGEKSVTKLITPTIYGGDLEVSGAYNIGGIVGYVTAPSGTNNTEFTFDDAYITQNITGKITLQSGGVGIYVGGIFGKLESNNSQGLILPEKITVDTSRSYYMGGLVGQLYMTDGSFDGSVKEEQFEDVSNENFGGLIGMLKVGAGDGSANIEVTGTHYSAFTINTIENENYYDGPTQYSVNDDDDIQLIAMATYINQDNYSIVPTSNTDIYSKNATNPINGTFGWTIDYTMFRKIQRCIPASKNGGLWDAISEVYDADNITYVATIENLELTDTPIAGKANVWQESLNTAQKEGLADSSIKDDADYRIPKPTTDAAKLKIYNTLQIVGREGDLYYYNPNYICYTIYAETNNKEKLYSSVGIASLYLEDGKYVTTHDAYTYLTNAHNAYADETNVDYYHSMKTLNSYNDGWWENVQKGFEWFWALTSVGEKAPQQTRYLDMASNNNLGLTYMNYSSAKSYDYAEVNATTDTFLQTNTEAKIYVFKVKDYKEVEVKQANGTTKTTTIPIYFSFDTLFENSSMKDLKITDDAANNIVVENCSDRTSTSGSIFEVNGVFTGTAQSVMQYQLNDTGWLIWAQIGAVILEIVITCVTFGGFAAGVVIKELGEEVVEWTAKRVVKFVGKLLWNGAKALIVSYILNKIVAQSIASGYVEDVYFNTTNETIGYMSESYQRKISYTFMNGKYVLDTETDKVIADKQENQYIYYSNIRPADFDSYYVYYTDDSGTERTIVVSAGDKNLSISNNIITATDNKHYGAYACTYKSKTAYAYNYYKYEAGAYYILMSSAEVEYTYTQRYLPIESLSENLDYITSDIGLYYVRDGYEGNLLKTVDEDGDKIVDEKGKETAIVNDTYWKDTYVAQQYGLTDDGYKEKVPLTFVAVTDGYLNDTALLQTDKAEDGYLYINNTTKYYDGYGYITRDLYYSASGDIKYAYDGDSSPTEIKQVGKFSNPSTTKPSGVEGVDWILVEVITTKEQSVTDPETGETTTKSVEESTPTYYTYETTATLGSVFGMDYLQNMEVESNNVIYINMYGKIQDTDYTDNVNNKLDAGKYYFLNEALLNNARGTTITQDATYYYYEGGYKFHDNKAYEEVVITMKDANNNGIGDVLEQYRKQQDDDSLTEKDVPMIPLYTSSGESQSFSYNEIKDNYSKGSITVEGETYEYTADITMYGYAANSDEAKEYLVSNQFYVESGTLYVLLSDAAINQGNLCTVRLSLGDNSSSNYNYNKYCVDASKAIYTRYKFVDIRNYIDGKKWSSSDYYLDNNSRYPNSGHETYIVEGCRVILSGGGYFYYGEKTEHAIGNINVYQS